MQNTIASLVDSAPETLNTLNELAKALNNDPSFATTVTNLIGEKESKTDANVEYEALRQSIAAKTVFNADGHLVFPNGAELWVDTTSTTASN